MQGEGEFIFRDGRKYIGEFKKDKRDGMGIYLWPDGRMYFG